MERTYFYFVLLYGGRCFDANILMNDFFFLQINLSGQNYSPKCAQTTFKGCKVSDEKLPGLRSQRKGHGSLFINDPIRRRKLCGAVSSRALHET